MTIMAMSKIIPKSLLLRPPMIALICHNRRRSTKSHHLDSSPSDEVIAVGVKKLEEAIHGMMVRRAAPDWLPFLPGYSYWVPPTLRGDLLTEDERMSCGTHQGWPCSEFFVDYTAPIRHIPVLELEVNIQDSEDDADQTSNSEDEGK